MPNFVKVLLLILTFSFGVLCIVEPLKISYVILKWVKISTRGSIRNPTVRKALDLMENNQAQFEIVFDAHLATIKRTGYIALVVSTVGFCLAFSQG